MNNKHKVAIVGALVLCVLAVISLRDLGGRSSVAGQGDLPASIQSEPQVGENLQSGNNQQSRDSELTNFSDAKLGVELAPEDSRLEHELDETFVTLQECLDQSLLGNLDYEVLIEAVDRLLDLEVSVNVYLGTDVGDGIRYPLLGTPPGVEAFLLLREDIQLIALELKIDSVPETPYFLDGVCRTSRRMHFGGRFDEFGSRSHCELIVQMPPSGTMNRVHGVDVFAFEDVKMNQSLSFRVDSPFEIKTTEGGMSMGQLYRRPGSFSIAPHPSNFMDKLHTIGGKLSKSRAEIHKR